MTGELPTLIKTVDVNEAQTHLQELLTLVVAGAEVILTEGNTPVARLVPIISSPVARTAGLHPGAIQVSDDFDEPIPNEFRTGNV